MDRGVLAELTSNIPLDDERSTFDGLAAGIDISLGLTFKLLKEEGCLLRSVQNSANQSLSNAQKWECVEWCLSFINSQTIEDEWTPKMHLPDETPQHLLEEKRAREQASITRMQQEIQRGRGHHWRYQDLFDVVHVDESWFLR